MSNTDSSTSDDQAAPGLSAKGVRTRRRLIAAARKRFGADAIRSVSVSAIAHDVGLTPAAVYPYFSDKEALFVAALDDEVTEWIGTDDDLAGHERPVVALFGRLVGELAEFPLVERTLRSGSGDHLRTLLDSTAIGQLRQTIERAIQQRQAAGTAVATQDPGSLAIGVETIVFSLLTTVVRTGLSGDPARLAGVIAIFEAALGPAPTPSETRP